jgi:RHS repeat-associated protein
MECTIGPTDVRAPLPPTGLSNLTGHQFEARTGHWGAMHRYLDPRAGRWTQRDLLGDVDGQNRYVYVGSRPMVNRDPVGLQAVPANVSDTLNDLNELVDTKGDFDTGAGTVPWRAIAADVDYRIAIESPPRRIFWTFDNVATPNTGEYYIGLRLKLDAVSKKEFCEPDLQMTRPSRIALYLDASVGSWRRPATFLSLGASHAAVALKNQLFTLFASKRSLYRLFQPDPRDFDIRLKSERIEIHGQ